MEVTYVRCAGLDIHKKSVTACCLMGTHESDVHKEIRTFGTMTPDLLTLADWLDEQKISHVAMESTSEYWKPVYNLLEEHFQLLVVNARDIKNVPGRKTDVKDAEWIADLLRHGLLKASFVPTQGQRDLRDLTRQRTNLVRDRATAINRLQKVLEWANIKLGSVATNVVGVSGRAMLEAIVQGQLQPEQMASLAKGSLRNKQETLKDALTGYVNDHHRFMITHALEQIDFLGEQIEQFDNEIELRLVKLGHEGQDPDSDPNPDAGQETSAASSPAATPDKLPLAWKEAVELLNTMPGIGTRAAESILAEIGVDMARFGSAEHLASWAKVSPGNNESAGKRYSGRTGKGNRWLRTILVQSAKAGVRKKNSFFSAMHHRLVVRRGANRATMAVARHMLVAIYHMLDKHEPYRDLGGGYYDDRDKNNLVGRMTKRLNGLGFDVIPHIDAATPATVFSG